MLHMYFLVHFYSVLYEASVCVGNTTVLVTLLAQVRYRSVTLLAQSYVVVYTVHVLCVCYTLFTLL